MKTLITVIIFSFSVTLFAQESIDLFIWAGQSNALGREGDAADYPADVDNVDSQIRFNWTIPNGSNAGDWVIMQPQEGYFTTGHFGPEVTFSRKLIQEGYNPAIFKFTQGATSLFQHWLNPGDGGLYDSMVTALNNAITELENQGHTVNVRGFVWIQGESDSNSDASANAYFNNLTILIDDLRTNVVDNVNLPVILGVDEHFFNVEGQERHQILNAHQSIAFNDANIKFTSMYGYPKADVTHLTPLGLITHGENLFDSYQLLVSEQYPQENCTLSSPGNHNSFERRSWGQSFITDCSGTLSTITFEAISTHNDLATFTLYNGADCSGDVLITQTLSSIDIGDNVIDLTNEGLYLDSEHTYYFDIVSSTNTPWRIDFSDIDNVFGVLRCTSDDGIETCGRTFLDYDMDFSVEVIAAQNSNCILTSSGNEVSFERPSWGQSFSTSCSGNLNAITFSAASALNENATFSLYNGIDCNSTAVFTQVINEITIGNNTVNINGITLDENSTYFFQIVADNNILWRIHYSDTDIVTGILHTFQNDDYCERTFPSFDMNFSVEVESNTQCAAIENVYSFTHDNKTYQIVKENKTWAEAANCAVQQGGTLARINDASEQAALLNELQNNAEIILANTEASNGGGASYVWIGGNDIASEGTWIWNDGTNDQFWDGDTAGAPVGGLYSNWGNEPDNGGNQDGLSIALTQWPINSGSLGAAGQWNDLEVADQLYFVIEYSTILSNNDIEGNNNIEDAAVFPNPVKDILFINTTHAINHVKLFNIQGQVIENFKANKFATTININFSTVQKGIYFLTIYFENGNSVSKKVIK